MGYRPSETTYRVDYAADSDFPGLSAKFAAPSLGEWLQLLDDDHVPYRDEEADPPEPEGFRASLEQRLFAKYLRSWNVEAAPVGKGRAVPVGVDVVSVLSQPAPMVRSLINQWGKQCRAVPDPLGGRSAPGEQPIDITSLPMTPPALEAVETG